MKFLTGRGSIQFYGSNTSFYNPQAARFYAIGLLVFHLIPSLKGNPLLAVRNSYSQTPSILESISGIHNLRMYHVVVTNELLI
jgi:hypothetical protein